MIKVKTGRDKSKIQYKRNSFLGRIRMASNLLDSIDDNCLTTEEILELNVLLYQIERFNKRLRKNKGKEIQIVNQYERYI